MGRITSTSSARHLVFGIALAVVLPARASAQCDPTSGHVFLFSTQTGIASMTLKTLSPVPGTSRIAGRGTLKLLDGTAIPVEARARARTNIQDTVSYKVKGISEPWHARGTIRLRGCPRAIERVRFSVRARGRARLLARDLTTISLAATASVRTLLMDEADIGGLLPDQTDGSHLAFRSDDPIVPLLEPGTIIVAGITSGTPNGLLRKVVSLLPQGTTTLLTTQPSTLLEAFEQLDIEVRDAQPAPAHGAASVLHPAITINGEGSIPLVNIQQGLAWTFTDPNGISIAVNGHIGVDAKLQFGIHTHTVAVIGTSLDSFHIEVNGNVTANVMASASYAAGMSDQHTLFETSLGVYEIGPIVLTPKFKFILGVEANLDAGISAEASAQLGVLVGVLYVGDWIDEKTVSRTLNGSVVVSSNATAKAFVRPELEVGLYDTVGAHVGLQPYVRLDADVTANPWWTLYAGVDGDLGIGVSFIGIDIASYDKTFTIFDTEIAHATDPPPTTTTTTTLPLPARWIGTVTTAESFIVPLHPNCGQLNDSCSYSEQTDVTVTFHDDGTLTYAGNYSARDDYFGTCRRFDGTEGSYSYEVLISPVVPITGQVAPGEATTCRGSCSPGFAQVNFDQYAPNTYYLSSSFLPAHTCVSNTTTHDECNGDSTSSTEGPCSYPRRIESLLGPPPGTLAPGTPYQSRLLDHVHYSQGFEDRDVSWDLTAVCESDGVPSPCPYP